MNELIQALIVQTLMAATPILLASLGEILTERSGVVNIGLEGLMLLGALFGPLAAEVVHGAGIDLGTAWPLAIAAASALAGALVGLLHGYISVYMQGNQIVSGVAINLMAAGLTAYTIQAYWKVAGYKQVPDWMKADPVPYMALAFLASLALWLLLTRTGWGAAIRAAGEDPEAASNLGIDVQRVRVAATVAGAALASLAGAFLSTAYLSVITKDIAAGRGFIALANVVFANWNPAMAPLGALVFGFFQALSYWLQTLGLHAFGLRYEVSLLMPYVATLAVAAVAVGRARPPRALARPFKKE